MLNLILQSFILSVYTLCTGDYCINSDHFGTSSINRMEHSATRSLRAQITSTRAQPSSTITPEWIAERLTIRKMVQYQTIGEIGGIVLHNGTWITVRDGVCGQQALRVYRIADQPVLVSSSGPKARVVAAKRFVNERGTWLVLVTSCGGSSGIAAYSIEKDVWTLRDRILGFIDLDAVEVFGEYLVYSSRNNMGLKIDALLLSPLGLVSFALQEPFSAAFRDQRLREVGYTIVRYRDKLLMGGCLFPNQCSNFLWLGSWNSVSMTFSFEALQIEIPLRTRRPNLVSILDGEVVGVFGGFESGSLSSKMCFINLRRVEYKCIDQDMIPNFVSAEGLLNSFTRSSVTVQFAHESIYVMWSNESTTMHFIAKVPNDVISSRTYQTSERETRTVTGDSFAATLRALETTTRIACSLTSMRNFILAGETQTSSPVAITVLVVFAVFFLAAAAFFLAYIRSKQRQSQIEKSTESSPNIVASTVISTSSLASTMSRPETTLSTTGKSLAIPGFLMSINSVDFTIGQVISEGGSGIIHECSLKSQFLQERAESPNCIVKVLKPAAENVMDDLRTGFYQEVALLWLFHASDYFAKIVGYCPEPLGILTKKCSSSLSELTHSGKQLHIEWYEASYSFCKDIALGLNELHATGIVHNDVKPDNILLDETPSNPFHVVLCDFGVATVLEESLKRVRAMKLSRIIGASIHYAAPEVIVFLRELEVDQPHNSEFLQAADVFAYAISIFEIVTRQRPWGDMSSDTVETAIKAGRRPILPPEVVKRCQKDPKLKKLVSVINGSWNQQPETRLTMPKILSNFDK